MSSRKTHLYFACVSVCISQLIHGSNESAFGQEPPDGTIETYRVVDGKLIPFTGTIVGEPKLLTPAEEMEVTLQIVGANENHFYQTIDGTLITKSDIVGGFISLDSKTDLNQMLAQSKAFSNILELSATQVSELEAIHAETMADLKKRAETVANREELNQLTREINAEFFSRIKSVLLPFQQKALIGCMVEAGGLLPAVSRMSQANILKSTIKTDDLKKFATEHLEKIESTEIRLKKELAESIIALVSATDRKEIERAVGNNLEDLIRKTPLENLKKQLEFLKHGGVPKYSTLREFAEKLSDDQTDSPQQK